MKPESCNNSDHYHDSPTIRNCPDCGKVVNGNITVGRCQGQSHTKLRTEMNKFCVDCGEQLVNQKSA